MRSFLWAATAAALLAVSAAAHRRTDQDFEFDDDAESGDGGHSRRPHRYVYDPHNSLCRSLVCKKREVCVLRDAYTALCATKKEIQRKGDIIVAAAGRDDDARDRDRDDDDVFYDAGAHDDDADGDLDADDVKPNRCVGCGARTRAQFLCGSDNRTYSSLCRLDLHNCVRRGARPVRLACRGFCPCPRRATRRQRRPRPDERRAAVDATPARPPRRRGPQGSEDCALDEMANRLLDWFSVLMDEAGATPPPTDGFPRDCKPEVRWTFAHLDADGDGLLSAENLYSLRHDERERCLRPFLASCGSGAGGGGGGGAEGVTRAAWCGCLRRAARPCTALARAHAGARAAGAYVPACDARGYYRPRQCHAALAVCWCVDAHGAELPGTRTKGAPACPAAGARDAGRRRSRPRPGAGEAEGAEGAEGAPADDEDGAGSGEAELRF